MSLSRSPTNTGEARLPFREWTGDGPAGSRLSLDTRSSHSLPLPPSQRGVAPGLSAADVWGLGARRWGPRSLLGALGDGLLADRWRENGNHHTVCLLTLLFLSFFFFFLLSQTLASKITSIGNPPSTSSMVHTVGFLCCCVCPACLSVPLLLNAYTCSALIHDGEGNRGGLQPEH